MTEGLAPHCRDSSVPVLVFGARITALGVIRNLARAGIPSYLVSDDPAFTARSRCYRALPPSMGRPTGPSGLAAWLESLPLDKAVLMPCSDDWVAAVAALPPSFSQRFPASISTPNAIQTFLDKGRFAELLARERLPHPRTILLDCSRQLEQLPDSELAGAFLKPRGSQEFCRRFGVKAFQVTDRAQAARCLGDALEYGVTLMLQDYIPGPPTSHYFIDGFVDRHGNISALFARRRWRMYPLDFGNSTMQASIPLREVAGAVDTIRRLWAAVPYRGIFSAEFKYDARDDLFKILEVNARPWWYIEFAALAGVDVSHLAYLDALGLPIAPLDPSRYQVGRRCVTLELDAKAFLHLRRQGQLSFCSWLRSWIGADHPVLSWTDPAPGLSVLWDLLKSRIHKN